MNSNILATANKAAAAASASASVSVVNASTYDAVYEAALDAISNLTITPPDVAVTTSTTSTSAPITTKPVVVNPIAERIAYINTRIEKEVCQKTINSLKDEMLIDTYKQTPSVQKNITKLRTVLAKQHIPEQQQDDIINDYVLELVPPGTKGVIRGNKFNKIVEDHLTYAFQEKTERFDVKFESVHPSFPTTEIPDWYIFDKVTGKIMIGMNQLDLWGGGQQINRGSKYLVNNKHNTEKSKLVCVVSNMVKIRSHKNKVFKLFDVGFENNTLCYLNGLMPIVSEYFNIASS